MQDELGRARRRNSRVLLPEEAESPMDRNPTIEVRAELIADCLDDAVMDQGMRDAAAGRTDRRRDLA